MTTLISRLLGYMVYDKEQAIYAKLVNGIFTPESPARFGNTKRELAVNLDKDYIYFSRNDLSLDFLNEYSSSWLVVIGWTIEDWEEAQDEINWDEAAKYLINNKNQIIAGATHSTDSFEDMLKMVEDLLKVRLLTEWPGESFTTLKKIWHTPEEDKAWKSL